MKPTLCHLLVALLGAAVGTAAPTAAPRVFATVYPTADLVVALFDARDFGALGTGESDDTAAIQRAIDACHAAGGGTVFVPRGRYRLDGPLELRSGVTLRGEWRNPEDDTTSGIGTLLCAHHGKGGDEMAPPLVNLHNSSGLLDLAVWYPEQSFTAPVPYAFTLAQKGGKNATVMNVTLFNSYRGIRLGPTPNELFTARDVYMTVLGVGLRRDEVYDCARFHRIRIKAKYWLESGLPGSPRTAVDAARLRHWQRRNVIGAELGHYAWTWMYDWEIEDCRIGIETRRGWVKSDMRGPNGGFVKLTLRDCQIGMRVGDLNPQGWSLVDAGIDSSLRNAIGIQTTPDFSSVCQLNAVTFGGGLKHAISAYGRKGSVAAIDCVFEKGTADGLCIHVAGGTMQVANSRFDRQTNHFHAGPGVQSFSLLGNRTPGSWDVIDETPPDTSRVIDPNALPHVRYTPDRFSYPDAKFRPAKPDLFLVTDFGATNAPERDCTSAFQRALTAARANGGGTVFIPTGRYRLDGTLRIPSGVELRGVFDVPHHTMDEFHAEPGKGRGMRGSELLTRHGRDEADAPAFIQLEPGSSVCGITVQHPEQTWERYATEGRFLAYPWVLQALGTNVHVRNVTLANAWRGADFGSRDSAGHRIDYLCGTVLETGLRIDRCTGPGWVKNVHWIGTYWSHSNYPGRPRRQGDTWAWEFIRDATIRTATGFVIGTTARENLLHTFIFGSRTGMRFVRGSDSGANGTFIMHGTDESRVGVAIEDIGEDLQLVNYQLVAMQSAEDRHYLDVGETVSPDSHAVFQNLLMWGYKPGPSTGLRQRSGHLSIQQANFTTHGTEWGIHQTGGRLTLTHPRFRLAPGAKVQRGHQGRYGWFGPAIDRARVLGMLKRGHGKDRQVIADETNGRLAIRNSILR